MTSRRSGRRSGSSSGSGPTRRTSRCSSAARDARRRVVHRRAAQLRRACARARGGPDEVAVVAHSQTRAPIELTFGELRDQVARARAGLQRLGVEPRRPRRRLHAQHPRDARGVPRDREPGGDLGDVRAGVRRPQRDRPVRHRSSPRCCWPSPATATATRTIDRRAEVAAIRAALPTLEHVVHVPYGPRRRSRTRSGGTTWSPSRPAASSSRCRSTTRSTCCSPPARPDCRRRSCTATAASRRALEEPGARAGTCSPATGCCGSRRPRG